MTIKHLERSNFDKPPKEFPRNQNMGNKMEKEN